MLNSDDRSDVIPLSERFNPKNEDIRLSEDVSIYTEKQYNDYGWTRVMTL